MMNISRHQPWILASLLANILYVDSFLMERSICLVNHKLISIKKSTKSCQHGFHRVYVAAHELTVIVGYAQSQLLSASSPPPSSSSPPSLLNKPAEEKNQMKINLPMDGSPWMRRVFELIEYKKKFGDTLVPKRFVDNPSLGIWVNKQRQQFRNFHRGEQPCSLTQGRIDILNNIGFCWDAGRRTNTKVYSNTRRSSRTKWWQRFTELQEESKKYENSDSTLPPLYQIPSDSKLGKWLYSQRKEFEKLQNAEQCKLDQEMIDAFQSIDQRWHMSHWQRFWEDRFLDLVDYKKMNGDCCVPTNFHNRQLAYWVSNQRRQYKREKLGLRSYLTTERIQQLDDIGFVWDKWEYEFEQKWELSKCTNVTKNQEGLSTMKNELKISYPGYN